MAHGKSLELRKFDLKMRDRHNSLDRLVCICGLPFSHTQLKAGGWKKKFTPKRGKPGHTPAGYNGTSHARLGKTRAQRMGRA